MSRSVTIRARRFMVPALILVAHTLWLEHPQRAWAQEPQATDDYVVTAWSAPRLPPGRIRALHQTKDGFLWVATSQGIRRFDGDRFADLPVATASGIAGDGKRAEPLSPRSGLIHPYVRIVYQAIGGALWVGTADGLTRVNGATAVRIEGASRLSSVRSLVAAPGGSVWVGTDGGLARVEADRLRAITLVQESVRCLLVSRRALAV